MLARSMIARAGPRSIPMLMAEMEMCRGYFGSSEARWGTRLSNRGKSLEDVKRTAQRRRSTFIAMLPELTHAVDAELASLEQLAIKEAVSESAGPSPAVVASIHNGLSLKRVVEISDALVFFGAKGAAPELIARLAECTDLHVGLVRDATGRAPLDELANLLHASTSLKHLTPQSTVELVAAIETGFNQRVPVGLRLGRRPHVGTHHQRHRCARIHKDRRLQESVPGVRHALPRRSHQLVAGCVDARRDEGSGATGALARGRWVPVQHRRAQGAPSVGFAACLELRPSDRIAIAQTDSAHQRVGGTSGDVRVVAVG